MLCRTNQLCRRRAHYLRNHDRYHSSRWQQRRCSPWCWWRLHLSTKLQAMLGRARLSTRCAGKASRPASILVWSQLSERQTNVLAAWICGSRAMHQLPGLRWSGRRMALAH
jgi:hypothetical protein